MVGGIINLDQTFSLPQTKGGKEVLRIMLDLRMTGLVSEEAAPLSTFDFDKIAAAFAPIDP